MHGPLNVKHFEMHLETCWRSRHMCKTELGM